MNILCASLAFTDNRKLVAVKSHYGTYDIPMDMYRSTELRIPPTFEETAGAILWEKTGLKSNYIQYVWSGLANNDNYIYVFKHIGFDVNDLREHVAIVDINDFSMSHLYPFYSVLFSQMNLQR